MGIAVRKSKNQKCCLKMNQCALVVTLVNDAAKSKYVRTESRYEYKLRIVLCVCKRSKTQHIHELSNTFLTIAGN